MATIYHPADAPREVTPANGTNFTLEEMQSIVGGYIQIIFLGNGKVMVINEEEQIAQTPRQRPRNPHRSSTQSNLSS